MQRGKMSRDKFWEIAFSSLLHDIGKFYLRSTDIKSSYKLGGKHPTYNKLLHEVIGYKFRELGLDQKRIVDLSIYHHESKDMGDELVITAIPDKSLLPYAYIISESDNISSGERYYVMKRGSGSYEEVMMDSIFNFVGFPDNENKVRIKAGRLDKDLYLVYEDRISNIDFRTFVREFNDNLVRIEVPKSFKSIEDARWTFFISLLSLLKFYLTLVPSDINVERKDVSLFDHLKTTCAISIALYLWHEEKGDFEIKSIKDRNQNKFLLIAGDLGGIQNYISGFKNVAGEGGVAKRLRARSFKVNAMSIGLASYIAKKLGLTYASVIYNTGGKFLLIAPNTQEVLEKLISLKTELNKYLIYEYGAILNINIGWIEACANDLMLTAERSNCALTLKKLDNALLKEKNRSFNSFLIKDGKWQEDAFALSGKWMQGEYCSICDSFPGKPVADGVRVCKFCEEDRELGGKLLKNNYVVITERNDGEFSLVGDLKIYLTKELELKDGDLISFNINNETIGYLLDGEKTNIPSGTDIRFSPYYAPTYEEDVIEDDELYQAGNLKTFKSIAKSSAGDILLGIVKADVDRLGYILSSKFPTMTLSRLSTFSFFLDYFFSYRFIKSIKQDYPETYIVFSGGDDLFCLGPWDQMVQLSTKLHEEFSNWVAKNELMSISCGVVLVDSRLPFYEITRIANQELSNAKKQEVRGKTSIFGQIVSPERLREIFFLAKGLSDLILTESKVEKRISRGVFQKLIEIYFEWKDYYEGRSSYSLPMYSPHLAYLINRNEALNPVEQTKSANKSLKDLTQLLMDSLKPSEAVVYMPEIGILSTIVLLLTRKID